jgi:hypothetical protein
MANELYDARQHTRAENQAKLKEIIAETRRNEILQRQERDLQRLEGKRFPSGKP